MLKETFEEVYDNFKLNFYKNIFRSFEKREATLTATETFACEVIFLLKKPTISDLSKFMGVSQPNMTYRINSLVKKGYVIKESGQNDKREIRLGVSEKYMKYERVKSRYISVVVSRMEERFTSEEIDILKKILRTTADELMPETSNYKNTLNTPQS